MGKKSAVYIYDEKVGDDIDWKKLSKLNLIVNKCSSNEITSINHMTRARKVFLNNETSSLFNVHDKVIYRNTQQTGSNRGGGKVGSSVKGTIIDIKVKRATVKDKDDRLWNIPVHLLEMEVTDDN